MDVESPAGGDRRPIAARNTRWAERAAAVLAARRVSPNFISIAGMLSAIAAGLALAATSTPRGWNIMLWLAAAVLIQLRLLANLFDGMVALATGRSSPVGQLYNDVPDRISDAAVLVGLGYASGGNITLGYVAALFAVLTAYIRVQCRLVGAPHDFYGPMAKQQRMFVATVACVLAPLLPNPLSMSGGNPFGVASIALGIIALGAAATSVRRLHRAAKCLRTSNQ